MNDRSPLNRLESNGVIEGVDTYRVLFDESPCPMSVQGPDFRLLEVNRAYCELTGFRREELIGIDPIELIPEASRPAVGRERATLTEDIDARPPFLRTLRCKDGSFKLFRLFVKPVDLGKVGAGYVVTLFEIVDGPGATRDANLWAERFNRLFDQAPAGLVVTEPDGRVRRANHEFMRLTGMSFAQLRALGPIFVNPASPGGSSGGSSDGREAGGNSHHRELWQRPDGQSVWLDRVTQSIEAMDGGPAQFTVVSNVTREMQAYSQLQSAMNEYRVLLDATAAGVLKLQHGRIIRANEALEQMFGVRAIDLLGRSPVRAFASRAEFRSFMSQAAKAMASGASYSVECRLYRPDRSLIECELQCRRVIDGDALAGIIVTVHDITELRAQERARMQAAAAQHKVLVREIHHRIKNNLQGVAGLIQSLAARRPELNEVLRGVAGQIRTMGQVYGLQQIDDLGSLPVRRLVHSIVTSQPPPYSSIQLTIDSPDDDSNGWRLPEQEVIPFALIVNELLTNAFKHGTSDPDVRVNLKCNDEGCELLISNRPASVAEATLGQSSTLDSGLGLVRAMLPSRHATLDLFSENNRVTASLKVRAPAVTKSVSAPRSATAT